MRTLLLVLVIALLPAAPGRVDADVLEGSATEAVFLPYRAGSFGQSLRYRDLETARSLGIPRTTFLNKMKRYGLR